MKTKRQKQKSGEFPLEVRRGNVTVKVYRVASARGYTSYQVPDYSTGRRVLRTFSDLEEAKAEAGGIADRTNTGTDVDVLELRSSDRASYQRALELLSPTNAKLEIAAGTYAEACRILGGDRIIEAAKFFAKKHPTSLPTKTVREVVDELIAMKTAKSKSVRYLSDLQYRLDKFADTFGCPIANVTGNEVQKFLDDLKLSERSYVNNARVIGTLFKFAVRCGYLPKDFDELDRLEKVDARGGVPEIYTVQEMDRLLSAASTALLPCLAIAGFAGLRSAEIERLDWSEVHLAERFIEITAAKAKTASRRLVPITDNLAAWLADYAKAKGKVWKGTHDEFYDAQQDTAAATGTEATPALKWKQNAMRHSFISYRLADIQNANQVAMEAGNSAGMIHAHYKELVRPADAKRWFGISPIRPANVLPATAAKREAVV